MKFWIFPLCTMILACAVATAQNEAPASKPSTAPAGVVPVTDLETIKANVDKDLSVRGKVSGTFKPRSGIILINFEGVNRDFVAMIDKDSAEAVSTEFEGDINKALVGKTVVITGPIKLYREKPEMVVTKAEQIKVEAGDAKAEEKKPEEKKSE